MIEAYLFVEREAVEALRSGDELRAVALRGARDRWWSVLSGVDRSVLVNRVQPVYPAKEP